MSPQLSNLSIDGARLFSYDLFSDYRGSFETFWEQADFLNASLSFRPCNSHHSYNLRSGTIRAFHLQRPPYGQSKLVSCVSGKVWDVILDLRPESSSFRQWQSIQLSACSGTAVYIPAGCAHGFATLEDNTTLAYLIEGEYRPEFAAAVLWNDPAIGVDWPVLDPIISDKDLHAPDSEAYLRSIGFTG